MKEVENVVKLHRPHPSRVQHIREWHSSQVQEEHVAMLNIAITSDNVVKATGLAIEPEYVAVLVRELDRIKKQLTSMGPYSPLRSYIVKKS